MSKGFPNGGVILGFLDTAAPEVFENEILSLETVCKKNNKNQVEANRILSSTWVQNEPLLPALRTDYNKRREGQVPANPSNIKSRPLRSLRKVKNQAPLVKIYFVGTHWHSCIYSRKCIASPNALVFLSCLFILLALEKAQQTSSCPNV